MPVFQLSNGLTFGMEFGKKGINIDNGVKTQKSKDRKRSILRLACDGFNANKCGTKKYKLATKLYNGIILLNYYKEKEFHYDSIDSEKAQKRANYYIDLQLELYPELEKIAKKLNLHIYSGTWWHVQTVTNKRDIYTDQF